MSKLNKDNYIWLKSHTQEIVTAFGVVTVALILIGIEKRFGDSFAGEIGIVFVTLSFLFATIFYFLFNKATNIKKNMQIVQGFSKFTDININDYSNNMSNAKNLLSDIEEIVKKLDQQTETSVESVEDSSQWKIRSMSDIRKIELNSDQIWIISNTLEVDTSDPLIQKNVEDNLMGTYQSEEGCKKTKGRYCYIIPKSIGYEADGLKARWKKNKNIPRLSINNVRFIEVESDSWLQAHDITIYNALTVGESACKYKKSRIIEFLEVEGKNIYRELPWEEYKSKIVPTIQKEIASHTNKYKTKKGCWNFDDLAFNQALEDAEDRGETHIEDLESEEFSIDEIQAIKDAVEEKKLEQNHLPESEILNKISKIIKQVKT